MGSFENAGTMIGSPALAADWQDEGSLPCGAPCAETERHTATRSNLSIRLGSVEIRPGSRTIILNGSAVDVGSRAFDVLMTLLNARGEIVSKEAMMREVWPTTTVDESNLRVQLSCLRRALGDERWRIKTIPGRGYFLIADTALDAEALGSEADAGAILVIAASVENIELLRRILLDVGASIKGPASIDSLIGFRRAAALPAPACPPVPTRLCPRQRSMPPDGPGRAAPAAKQGIQ